MGECSVRKRRRLRWALGAEFTSAPQGASSPVGRHDTMWSLHSPLGTGIACDGDNHRGARADV